MQLPKTATHNNEYDNIAFTMLAKNTGTSFKFIRPPFSYLIEKKRDGGEFAEEEIRYIVDSILDKTIPPCQLAALTMAIYFQGMSAQETAILTEEMMLSGEVIDLSEISKPKVVKCTTGGVGDKTTLVLTPLAAACGVIMPSINEMDEDFVISTLDKMSVIPGFKKDMPLKKMVDQLKTVGCAIVSQREEVAPAGNLLYEMRRNTGTIPSLPLIAGTMLSKKLAEGAEGIVVDVKWGNGSFVSELEQSKQLARYITRVARTMKRRCVALVSDMNQPLGNVVGTGLEIQEAIELLHGRGPEELQELILKLGMEIVRIAGVAGSTLSAKQTVEKCLNEGHAFKKFKEMVAAQGGQVSFLDNPNKFPRAQYVRKLPAPKRGYVHAVNAGMIVRGVHILAADQENNLDPSVGISSIKKIGAQVKQGEPLMMIHYNDESKMEVALEYLRPACRIAPKRPVCAPIVVERVA